MGYQPNAGGEEKGEPKPVRAVTKKEDLEHYFSESFTKPEDVRIGMEVEKNGVHKSNLLPVTYLEQNGVRSIQQKFIDELNWVPERQEGKFITSMERGGSHLTLEYAESSTELSGRTHPSIHDLARELRIHQHELSEISRIFDVVWLGIGYYPFSMPEGAKPAKLRRFEMLQEYFRGKGALWTMHWGKLCSVQANIDYTSEEDMQRKFQILLRLTPFLGAMYAHSPIKDGKNTGYVSYRMNLLRQFDRRRFGIRKLFLEKSFRFRDWVDFCLRIPMIAIFRNDQWIPVKKLTFNQFVKSGYEGYAATIEDWVMHLSFVYTDVRIKKYIEVRICDSLPPFLIPSMQAIVKGFVYHKEGLAAITELTKDWDYRDFAGSPREIAKHGMQTEWKGRKILDICKEIVNIATTNLRSFQVMNEKNEDESVHLQPIKEFVFVKEKSPGRYVMDNWEGSWNKNPARLIEWCSFENLPSANVS